VIYCTSGGNLPIEFVRIYEEWTGRMPEIKTPLVNSFLVIAKVDDEDGKKTGDWSEYNKIVGAAQYIIIDDPVWRRRWALVENVYVAQNYRRQGVGTKLMKFVEDQAYLFGCDFIKLTSRKEAGKALYRSLDYEEGSSFYKKITAKNNKAVAVIQTRMNSTRLPGKALADINGKPLLRHIIDRIKPSKHINKIIIATNESSPEIIEFAKQNNIDCYAGSDTDLLDRLYKAVEKTNADTIVQIWGDCPCVNARIIDEVIEFFKNGFYDYAFNFNYPTGHTVAVMGKSVLENAWREVKDLYYREWTHEYFTEVSHHNIGVLKSERDLSHIKLSVDTTEDLEYIRKLFREDNEILR
jgi:spore coat polysaccharide biosynthesis protein SpsF